MPKKEVLSDVLRSIKGMSTPIHREGYVFIAIFAIITALLALIWNPLGWMGMVATCWCVYFFRDPVRFTPTREGLIVATGDGIIQKIEKVAPPKELKLGDEKLICISIFLNVFNVHVNRTPVDGTITATHYRPGKFFNADLDKASEENERQSALIETDSGKEIVFVQVAGLVARRIICHLVKGQKVVAGERYGLIRFGSRCDIYLPKGTNPMVCVGQTTVGGETILADLKSKEKTREPRAD